MLRRAIKSARFRVYSAMHAKNSIYLVLLTALAGCATLPANGPTQSQIENSVQMPLGEVPIQLLQVQNIADVPASETDARPAPSPIESPPLPTDLVGAGDALDISIYETGVALFSSGEPAMGQGLGTPGAQVQKLPPIRIDDDGNITLPYTGTLHVAGRTIREIEMIVRGSLQGMSQNPQVLITLGQAITNSVIIGGEIARPGRLVLQTNKERLSDVVALAGGYRGDTKDLLARVFRRDDIIDVRLNDLVDNPSLDMRISPGNRLMLLNEPRIYSVLGASGNVAQFAFNRSSVTLVEAIATAGGANSNTGNSTAIFLFRYAKDERSKEIRSYTMST